MTRPLVDAEARRRIRDDLDATFVVEAAAGTGKTTALVSRIVSLVRSGRAELQGIVAVTFTEAAAGEMKLRVRAALERERVSELSPDERVRLERALAQLEEARIGTIHSLCVDLLRERPVEAGVDPLFQVSPDDDARRLFDHAFDVWFQRALESPPEGVRRILRRRRRGRDAMSSREVLRDAAFRLLEHRDFTAPWRRDPFDRIAAIDALVEALKREAELAELADRDDDFVRRIFVKIRTFVAELARREAIRPRDHDGLESELVELARDYEWTFRYGGHWYARGRLTRAQVLERKDRLKADLDDFVALAEADLAAALHAELMPLVQTFESLEARAGKLDFLDLLLRARALVRDRRDVRAALQRRFTHVFVDEFQDTDPLQAEILLLLSADDPGESRWERVVPRRGKLFLVGDPKQSIYRFRRADVALYEQVKRRLVADGAEVLHLVSSFRGAPAIQEAVNAAFSLQMIANDAGTQAGYVPLSPVRDEVPGRPSVVALPVPRPYGEWGKINQKAIDASLPDAVGAFVEWLVRASGWRVSERERPGELVPVAPRHVCLLFKRLQAYGNDTTRPYVRALEARGIAHVLVGGRSFHAREEIAALRAVLNAIEWPDDELSVFAALRGPFFALSDEALLAFSAARAGSAPFHPLRPAAGAGAPELTELAQPVLDALAILAELHRRRNQRPIADTIGRFLEATRAHAGVAIWPTGEQSLANVLRLVDMARRFESSGATSFRAFVDMLEEAAQRGAASDAPVVEEGTDGVRVMTVHKAKGLEFPVVILVDPNAPLSRNEPTHHADHARGLWVERLAGCAPIELLEERDEVCRREREEGVRLAYVAATRARDLLVVPVVGDERREGWLDVLHPAIYPRDRNDARPAEGCPRFSGDSVFERPANAKGGPDDAVAPGEHVPERGAHRVVWWCPRALDLGREVDVGLRQQAILVADEDGGGSGAAARDHDEWQARRARLAEEGAKPTLRAMSATALAHAEVMAEAAGDAAVPTERVEGDRAAHPRGKRFGALVHAVLAAVPLDHPSPPLAVLAEAHGRLLGADAGEVAAAVERVGRALAHPLMVRAKESGRAGCRREVNVALRRADGTVVDGIVDLAFRAPGDAGWTVVDFKTDAELDAEALCAYEAQVRLYAAAIAEATGAPASGVLLSV
ncbi:MAG: UvrD-helicase domain-containing protein [Deltaproteobacteria bacterium]|nr:UvrD-helicase domain-containing protein [Deltaproteobacteria bacterium]